MLSGGHDLRQAKYPVNNTTINNTAIDDSQLSIFFPTIKTT